MADSRKQNNYTGKALQDPFFFFFLSWQCPVKQGTVAEEREKKKKKKEKKNVTTKKEQG